MRGGSWNNNRDNARCAYRNRNQPDNRNDNLGFRVVLVSAHVLPSLLLVPPFGGMALGGIRPRGVPAMRADSGSRDLSAEVKEEEQRQTGLVRAQAARQGDNRGVAGAGHLSKRGAAWPLSPPRPPRPVSVRRFAASLAHQGRPCLTHPAPQQPAQARHHTADVLVLAAAQPFPVLSQAQVEPQLVEVGIGGFQVSEPCRAVARIRLEQRLLEVQGGTGQSLRHKKALRFGEALAMGQ